MKIELWYECVKSYPQYRFNEQQGYADKTSRDRFLVLESLEWDEESVRRQLCAAESDFVAESISMDTERYFDYRFEIKGLRFGGEKSPLYIEICKLPPGDIKTVLKVPQLAHEPA